MENQKEIFGKNYQIMFTGLAFIITGFILMSGGDTEMKQVLTLKYLISKELHLHLF